MRTLGLSTRLIGRSLALVSALACAPLVACGDDEGDDKDTTTTADTTANTDTTATSPTDTATASETAQETVTEDPTWDDIYPIFASNCTPCHAGNGTDPTTGSGGHSIGSADKAVAYDASQQTVSAGAPAACAGKKVAECAILRIEDGSMPASGDCSDDPPGAKCPDAAEQQLIKDWIAAGMPE